MNDSTTDVVWLRRQWNDSLSGLFRLSDVSGWHWSDMSGGVYARANRFYLHGYVSCDAIIDGEVSHRCMHGPAPHRIKVCFVQKDNSRALFELIKVMVA